MTCPVLHVCLNGWTNKPNQTTIIPPMLHIQSATPTLHDLGTFDSVVKNKLKIIEISYICLNSTASSDKTRYIKTATWHEFCKWDYSVLRRLRFSPSLELKWFCRIILVNNQLGALFFNVFICFPSLHVSSNPVLIIRRIKLCLICRSATCIPDGHLHRVIYTRWCIDTIWFPWWWVLGCSKHVQKGNKYIEKSASSCLLTRII